MKNKFYIAKDDIGLKLFIDKKPIRKTCARLWWPESGAKNPWLLDDSIKPDMVFEDEPIEVELVNKI